MITTDICRVCMDDNWDAFNSLFNPRVEVPVTPAVMISYCAGISVEQDDGVPGVACTECLNALREAFKIREECRKVDRKLMKILNMIRPEFSIDQRCSQEALEEIQDIPEITETPVEHMKQEEIQELLHFGHEYLVEELKESNEEAVDDSQRLDMSPPLPLLVAEGSNALDEALVYEDMEDLW
ncbi:uncharacterized protein LOC110674271 [Aedes aegypti]|uniref:Uncharacterized protein n=1 Tax=Aedes aegypti TaxID=7159 RepID=A0A6I8TRF4_AEDAE|nr:uncharacterized protein LOC110674271 [Aedes aegypti]